jgi:predicted SprT family Zn-dependent metalloprotease
MNMNLDDVKILFEMHAEAAGLKVGPGGWRFEWGRGYRTLGTCVYRTKTIRISRPYAEVNEEKQVEQTVIHEVAHAVAGPYAKHGPEWKRVARNLGMVRPRARVAASSIVVPQAERSLPWTQECPSCGATYHRRTRPIQGRTYRCRCADRTPVVAYRTGSRPGILG